MIDNDHKACDCDHNEDNIPHICHFFYTGRTFENQILHQKKKRLKAPKTLKMSLKKSNICIFSLNLEKFTPARKFLHRHVCGVCDKHEVCIHYPLHVCLHMCVCMFLRIYSFHVLVSISCACIHLMSFYICS